MTATPGQAGDKPFRWEGTMSEIDSEVQRRRIESNGRRGLDHGTPNTAAAIAAQEPQPTPLSALGGRSGELTVDEVQELRGKLEASLAQSARQPKLAPDLGTAWRLLDEARASLRELTAAMLALAGEWVADAEHDETRVRPTVISDARARTLRECADELRKRTGLPA